MKTIAIGSIFVLFAIVAGIVTPSAFADHAEASVSAPAGTSVPGCEETDECFMPSTVTIDVGGVVTWSNDDTAAHTVTSGAVDTGGPDGNFDSSLFMAGTTFEWTSDTAGEFPYFCMVHPWMDGIVIVEAEGAGASEGDVTIEIESEPAAAGEVMSIVVKFEETEGIYYEHVNYNIKATQDGQVVLDEQGVHDHDGVMSHTTMALPSAASGDNPVDVDVEFLGFGIDPPFTGPIGQMGETQVVPEFGTIAVMILGIAIISIIAVTARSKVIPRL